MFFFLIGSRLVAWRGETSTKFLVLFFRKWDFKKKINDEHYLGIKTVWQGRVSYPHSCRNQSHKIPVNPRYRQTLNASRWAELITTFDMDSLKNAWRPQHHLRYIKFSALLYCSMQTTTCITSKSCFLHGPFLFPPRWRSLPILLNIKIITLIFNEWMVH